MGCIRPCGIQSGQQTTTKEYVEFSQKIDKVNKMVVDAKKLYMKLMQQKNHYAFHIIIANWIPRQLVVDYILDKEEKERLRLQKLRELEALAKMPPPEGPKKNKCLGTRVYCY